MRYSLLAFLFLLTLNSFGRVLDVCQSCAFKAIVKAIENANAGDTVRVQYGAYHEGNIIINKQITLLGINHPIVDGDDKYEIFSVGASGTIISGFTIQNSGKSHSDDKAGIKLLSVKNVLIHNNILCNNAFGIYLMNSNQCVVSNNMVEGNDSWKDYSGNGIHLWKCDSIRIENNEVTHHRDGIYFEFVTNSTIENNRSERNYRYGLHFMFSHDDVYSENYFSENGAGVAVMYSHGVHMYRNNFHHNWGSSAYGLLLKDISDGEIEENIFTENTTGIYLEGSSRMKITNCKFSQNGYAMKMMANCSDNVVENNIFNGNSFDVSTNGTLVMSKFHRNYWDKYDGYDLDHNGIGDIPYRPASVFGVITERVPHSMLLYRSFISGIIDKMENYMPEYVPEKLLDDEPLMKPPIV